MKAPILITELEVTEPIDSITLPTRDDGLAYNGVRPLCTDAACPCGICVPSAYPT